MVCIDSSWHSAQQTTSISVPLPILVRALIGIMSIDVKGNNGHHRDEKMEGDLVFFDKKKEGDGP